VDRVLERLAVSPHCARVVTPVILLLTVVVHETRQRFIRLFADEHSYAAEQCMVCKPRAQSWASVGKTVQLPERKLSARTAAQAVILLRAFSNLFRKQLFRY
jgi:hypothetical protein